MDAISRHFAGRVRDWAMWNETDIGEPKKTPEAIAAFNVRTAKIVKRNIPDSRIAGLSLAHNDPAFLEECLKAMGEDVKLFDWIIYHGYAPAPESSYGQVEAQFVFWTHAEEVGKLDRAKGVLGEGEYAVRYNRPGDSFTTRPAVFKYAGRPLNDPVWVDLLTGRIYEFPRSRQLVHSGGVTFVNVPVYDSPCVLTERGVVLK